MAIGDGEVAAGDIYDAIAARAGDGMAVKADVGSVAGGNLPRLGKRNVGCEVIVIGAGVVGQAIRLVPRLPFDGGVGSVRAVGSTAVRVHVGCCRSGGKACCFGLSPVRGNSRIGSCIGFAFGKGAFSGFEDAAHFKFSALGGVAGNDEGVVVCVILGLQLIALEGWLFGNGGGQLVRKTAILRGYGNRIDAPICANDADNLSRAFGCHLHTVGAQAAGKKHGELDGRRSTVCTPLRGSESARRHKPCCHAY